MFRCGQFFSIRRLEPPVDSTSGDDRENGDYRSPTTTRLCCHICSYKTDDVNRFWRHLRADHRWGTDSSRTFSGFPAVKVLVEGNGAQLLQRCGFCPFESTDCDRFARHVADAHELGPPLTCSSCRCFASFSEYSMRRHLASAHPADAGAGWEPLKRPYTMLEVFNADETNTKSDTSFAVSPSVALTDVSTRVAY